MPLFSLAHQQLDLSKLSTLNDNGLNAVDIYVGDGVGTNAHISFENYTEQAATVHKHLQDAGLQCAIVRSAVGTDDIDSIVKLVEIAKALDCEFITVNVPQYDPSKTQRALLSEARSCYQDLNQISSETGVDALITIDPDSICPNADAAMRILEGLDPSQVGVLFNPALCSNNADIIRSVDCLGLFLRAICCTPDNQDAVLIARDASQIDDLCISILSDDAQKAATLTKA